MNPRRPCCSLLVVTVLAKASICSASSTPPIVRVYVAGSPEAVSGSRAALQDLCAHENVAVVVRDAASADEALLAQAPAPGLAEAYVDLRPGSAPRVVVIDGETRKDLERRELPEDASLEISIETAAHVVCAAVDSMLATRAAAAASEVGPPAPAPPVITTREPRPENVRPKPRRRARWSSQLDLFASGTNFGAGFRVGAGAAFGLSHGSGAFGFGALLSVTGYPTSDVAAAGGVADFGVFGARLLPSIEWQATRTLLAFAGIGGGADWVGIAAERPPPGAVEERPTSSLELMATGQVGVRWQVGSGVALLLAVDADADLVRHRYVIQTPRGNQTFFEPARLRPMALAGLSVALARRDTGQTQPNEARK